jgi:PPP family 3-phenylpropionic acid transporter
VFDARRYGRVRVWGSIGFMVTALAAGLWFERFGIAHFPAWTLLTLVWVTASAWMLPNLREATAPAAAGSQSIAPVLRQRPVQWLFASIFFHVLAHMSLYLYLSLYLDSLGYGKGVIGLVWAISVLVEVVWFFTQSRWLPRWSLSAWLMVCAGATALRMGLTSLPALGLLGLLLAQCLHALTFAAHHTVCQALLSHHFPGRLRGRGQALYTVVGYGFPGVLAGLTGGALSAAYGLNSVYLLAMVVSLVALFCAWRAWRCHHPSKSQPGSQRVR